MFILKANLMTDSHLGNDQKLPKHIEDAISAMAKLHSDHQPKPGTLQRWVENTTALLGRPTFTLILTGAVLAWITVNLTLQTFGQHTPDPPPFALMSSLVSLAALYMAGLILATQRREFQSTTRREQLTLELSIRTEQKVAKLIELIEQLRQDHPDIADRIDKDALEMATSVDLHDVLDAIKTSHEESDE